MNGGILGVLGVLSGRKIKAKSEPTRNAIDGFGVEQRVEPSQNGGVKKECGT